MKVTRALTVGLGAALVIVGLFTYLAYGSGTLVIEMMDSPEQWGAASQVYIHYSAIMVHRAGAKNESGWKTVVKADGWMNLTSVVNVSRAIGQGPLQAGRYNLVRFNITEAVVTVEGQNYTAPVVNGKLNVPITKGEIRVDAGQKTHLVMDITPRITGSQQGYRLVPAAKATPG